MFRTKMTITQNTFPVYADSGFVAVFDVTQPHHQLLILSTSQADYSIKKGDRVCYLCVQTLPGISREFLLNLVQMRN